VAGGVRYTSVDGGFMVETQIPLSATVLVVDVLGRVRYHSLIPSASSFVVPIAEMNSSVYGVTVIPSNGSPIRFVVNR
jgi:hypothetical protein